MKQRQKYLASLSTDIQKRLVDVIELLISWKRDRLDIKQLQWEKNFYRCRVWSLRIIFSTEWKDITIRYIGPRWDIYK